MVEMQRIILVAAAGHWIQSAVSNFESDMIGFYVSVGFRISEKVLDSDADAESITSLVVVVGGGGGAASAVCR